MNENNETKTTEVTGNPTKALVIQTLKTIFDPEIPVNIYDLGMFYNIDIDDENNVNIKMTLTSPACPVAESLPGDVQQKIKDLDVIKDCKVELVWDPPWEQSMMTEEAKLELNMF